jgi:hypothetical protein
MHHLGLRPFCQLQFCSFTLSIFPQHTPMVSQAPCCNSVFLIDLPRPAETPFVPLA